MEFIQNLNSLVFPFISLLIASIFAILLKPGFFTFFSLSAFERKLISKEAEYFRLIFIFIFIFMLIPLAATYSNYDYFMSLIYKLGFKEWFNHYFITFIIFSWVLVLSRSFTRDYLKSVKYRWASSLLKIYNPLLIFSIYITVIFGMLILIIVGLALTEVLKGTLKDTKNIVQFIPITYTIMILYLPVFWNYHKLAKSQQKVKIKLSTGETISNCYLLHSTFGNHLIVGDHYSLKKCTEKISIKRDLIVFIKCEDIQENVTKDKLKITIE